MVIVDPTLHTAVLSGLEAGINRALALDPGATDKLVKLRGATFHIESVQPEVDVYLQVLDQGIRLMGIWDGDITTGIRGRSSDFAELARSADPAATLINSDLELTGDSAPLIELQRIVAQLDMDWESPLVDTLGDITGRQLADVLRGLFSWGQQASDAFVRQLDEFIHIEAQLAPSRAEVDDFYSDIAQLGQRVEKLQARLQRWRSQRVNP